MSELKAEFLCGLDNARKSNFCCYAHHILHNDFGEWKIATPMDKLEDAEINRMMLAASQVYKEEQKDQFLLQASQVYEQEQ